MTTQHKGILQHGRRITQINHAQRRRQRSKGGYRGSRNATHSQTGIRQQILARGRHNNGRRSSSQRRMNTRTGTGVMRANGHDYRKYHYQKGRNGRKHGHRGNGGRTNSVTVNQELSRKLRLVRLKLITLVNAGVKANALDEYQLIINLVTFNILYESTHRAGPP